MHHFPVPPSSATATATPAPVAAAVAQWARAALGLEATAVVFATEQACRDAGCPVVETTLTVLEPGRTRRWRLAHPRGVVTKTMVQQTLTAPPWQTG